MKSIINTIDGWGNSYKTIDFNYIEQFSHYNITADKIIKYMDNYKHHDTNELFGGYENEKSIYKNLIGKTLFIIYTQEEAHTKYIVYCKEDKCCYGLNLENQWYQKISIQQLLNVSKQSYADIQKMIKEYNKK